MHTINWYPGHMAKARRMLEDNLKLVDMIIEIVDARAPMACRNPDFEALFKNKLRVVVLNKSDLSSKTQNRAWINYFAKQGIILAPYKISQLPKIRLIKFFLQTLTPTFFYFDIHVYRLNFIFSLPLRNIN